MKPLLIAACAAASLAPLIAPAPVYAQNAEQHGDRAEAPADPVRAGVEAWQRGDFTRAVALWRDPAVAGNADAQFNLGQAYKLGRGVAADLAQAEEWYRRAAVQGHPQAEDNYGLALFQNGKRTQSVLWLEKSAARGEPRAQFVLGTMYFNGDVVERDWVKAYALVTRASQSGLTQASGALAQMDRYISVGDRQQALALARRYEEDAGRPQLPVDYAGPTELPDTPAAPTPVSRPTPAPTQVAARPPAPVPVAKPAPAPAPVVRDGGWRIQLGAFGEPGNAQKLWANVSSRFPGLQPYYVPSGRLTKLLVGPFASSGEASAACRKISPCIPVRK